MAAGPVRMSHPAEDGLENWYEEITALARGPQRRVPAWLFSFALHATIFLLIGLLGASRSSPSGQPADRAAGIALVQRSDEKVSYYSESAGSERGGKSTGSTAAVAPGAAASPFPTLEQLPSGLAASLPSRDDLKVAAGGGPALPGADSFSRGGGMGRGLPGGGTSTQVFGARGTGNRFVYVFDRSASMGDFGGRPLQAAKQQLLASLEDLGSTHQFLIIFYNEEPSVFNPDYPRPPSLVFGTDQNKRLAEQFISRIRPDGGTRHDEALRLALNVRPDVIFLLTDADDPKLTQNDLESIHRRNRGGTIINTIEFGSRPSPAPNNFMMRLASQNQGQHVYVDVSQL